MSDLITTVNFVVDRLKEHYSVSSPIFLSRFYQEDGDQWLYSTLSSLYKPEYQPTERLIFVQDCNDIYDYHDLPGKVITQLQKYVAQIDISNFFIIVISVNKFIGQELNQAKELYSTDENAIQHFIIDTVENRTVEHHQDTFCVLPWVHLYVGPDGNVLPCCIADQTFPGGNIKEQSVESILTSDYFTAIRENMLNNRRSKECNYCYTKEDAGFISLRKTSNQRWNVSNPTAIIKKFNPVSFDIRLSNVCNLKCRMCSSYYSSAIANEENKMFGIKNEPVSLKYQQYDATLTEILEYSIHAEKIYFAGGEPLLSKEHYSILHQLINCGNTDLDIFYSTNFTTLQYQNFSVLDLWKQFLNVTIGASLDAQGPVAEYVRHGTEWKNIEHNLVLLKKHCPHVNFTVSSTVGFLTVTSLIDLQKRWHESRVLDISKFSLNAMISPAHLTVAALPSHHKSRLEIIIQTHIQWCKNCGAISLANQWHDVLNYMLSTDNSHHLGKFKKLTNVMDNYRKESLATVLPEYKDLI
jgi:radical SAM protein with 4Fe4S-binding SPASM domain